MGNEIPQSVIELYYPEHWEVISSSIAQIQRLSRLENTRYGRTAKPPGMQIQFLIDTDVTCATFAGKELDIRTRQGLVSKPSEILEAAQALSHFYAMSDVVQGREVDVDFTHALEDTAAEAIVELSDVVYNAFQMFLTDSQYGEPLLLSFVENMDPASLSVLLEVAKTKYAIRYEGENGKDIQSENKTIRELLIQGQLDPIFKVLNVNRQLLPQIMQTVLAKGREVARTLGVLNDNAGNDIAVKDYHLSAFLSF